MGTETETYVVQSGDWLAKIAREHSTTVAAIWNHPENAALRAQRGSPDVLYPGDILRIPVGPAFPTDSPPPVPPVPPNPAPPVPPNPAPPVPTTPPGLAPPIDPPWPYEPFEAVWSRIPTWDCPEGICKCRDHEDDTRHEHTITFHQLDGHRFCNARCRVYEGGRLITEEPTKTGSDGRLTVELRASTRILLLEWAPHDVPVERGLPYRKVYHVHGDHTQEWKSHTASRFYLANLGFQECQTHRENLDLYKRTYHKPPSTSSQAAAEEARRHHDNGTLPPFPRGPSPHDLIAHQSLGDPSQQGRPQQVPPQPAPHQPAPHQAPPATGPEHEAGQPPADPAGGPPENQCSGSTVPDATHITVGVAAGGIAGTKFECARLRLLINSISTPAHHPTFRPNQLLEPNLRRVDTPGVYFTFYNVPHGVYTAQASVRAKVKGSDVWFSDTLRIRTSDGNPGQSSPPPNICQNGRGWVFRDMRLPRHTLAITGPTKAHVGQTVRLKTNATVGPIRWSIASAPAAGRLDLQDSPLHREADYTPTSAPGDTSDIVATDPCDQTAAISVTTSKQIEELLVVVGTEHIHKTHENKLIFLAQAVRVCRKYQRDVRFHQITVLAFPGGYPETTLKRVKRQVEHYGGRFQRVSSWTEVVHYVKKHTSDSADVEIFKRVQGLMFFCHGAPGYLLLNGSRHVNEEEFRRLVPAAFRSLTWKGPIAQINSWACQTGNKGDANLSERKNLEGSLAQAMADHVGKNTEVFAFGTKCDYTPTWADPNYGHETTSGGYFWQDEGADGAVVTGTSSNNNKMTPGIWCFRHGMPAMKRGPDTQ